MSNFSQRLITGIIYVLLVFFSLLFHHLIFGLITILFNFIAVGEFVKMSSPENKKGSLFIQISSSMLLLAIILSNQFRFDSGYPFMACLVFALIIFMSALFQKTGNPVLNLSMNILSLAYITIPLILINFVSLSAFEKGIPFVLAMFIFIWINDTFAYLFGITFGKHKIFERISPKKSWEGFIGGLIMVLFGTFIFSKLYPVFGWNKWLLFGFITAIFSVLGDFIESLFKRTYGVKDSGSILPGHGGILDRIDSLLFAAPAVYIFLNFILKQAL